MTNMYFYLWFVSEGLPRRGREATLRWIWGGWLCPLCSHKTEEAAKGNETLCNIGKNFDVDSEVESNPISICKTCFQMNHLLYYVYTTIYFPRNVTFKEFLKPLAWQYHSGTSPELSPSVTGFSICDMGFLWGLPEFMSVCPAMDRHLRICLCSLG